MEYSVTLTVKNGEGIVRMKLEPEAGTGLVQPGEETVLRGNLLSLLDGQLQGKASAPPRTIH